MQDNSKFMNNANIKGEVRDTELAEVGGRTNEKLKVNIHCNGSFINMQLRTPSRADTNYAEQLYDMLSRGDKIEINGSLEEYLWEKEYRRNVQPYCSTANGVGNNVKVYPSDTEIKEMASARLAGDVIEKTPEYDEEGELILNFTLLYWNTYNPEDRDNPLSRKEVLKNAIQNYGSYQSKQGNEFNEEGLANLIKKLEDTEEFDLETIVKIYKKFDKEFNPFLFNISEYHITARDNIAEDMSTVDELDNISLGVYIKNETILDDFGFSDGTTNELQVGRFVGINQSFSALGEEEEDKIDW